MNLKDIWKKLLAWEDELHKKQKQSAQEFKEFDEMLRRSLYSLSDIDTQADESKKDSLAMKVYQACEKAYKNWRNKQ